MNDFHEKRKQGIGGSDVAPILGISPYKTPLDVYLDKVNPIVKEQSPKEQPYHLVLAHLIEPFILDMYSKKTGEILVPGEHRYQHKDYPFILSNLDGRTKSNRVVEAKMSRSADGWGEEGSDEIPLYYTTQVQHYMMITGDPVADVAVLIAGQDFRIYHVEADKELQEMLIEKECEFWDRVVNKNPPDTVNVDDVLKLYPRSLKNSIEATPDILNELTVLNGFKARIKEIEKQKEILEYNLKGYIKDHDGITMDGKPLVTWKTAKDSVVTDWKEAYESLEGIIDEATYLNHKELYTSRKPGSRRFLIK